MNKKTFEKIFEYITNKLLLFAVLVFVLFYILAAKLFDIQITNGGVSDVSVATDTREQPITIAAPRGVIYDSYGRPLATNESAFSVTIDPSADIAGFNTVALDLVRLFEKNGDKYVDSFPISKTEPFTFTFSSASAEKYWRKDMNIPEDCAEAAQAFDYLRKYFKLDAALSNADARRILNIRSMIYLQRYHQYNLVTVAYGVSNDTVVEIQEHYDKYTGFQIEEQPLREYPAGIYLSHILGYVGIVNNTDITGRTGLEKSFEDVLKGVDGNKTYLVDSAGRPLRTIASTPPVQGNKLFLTIDEDLQKKTYGHLKDKITELIENQLTGKGKPQIPITIKQIFSGLVRNNNLDVKELAASASNQISQTDQTYSRTVWKYVTGNLKDPNPNTDDGGKAIVNAIADGVNSGGIPGADILLALCEQGVISDSNGFVSRVKSGKTGLTAAVIEKLDAGEITPQMLNLDPCSGSAVVIDVKTGAVIAAVGYPSYDNNELVNNFNNDYWAKLIKDQTSPLINRPFAEPRAPGSTFKMVTAMTGLETGVITPTTLIHDGVVFTKVGQPYVRNWASYSFGSINVSKALEVSCNFFFCELAYRMIQLTPGDELSSIHALDKYMTEFGLNDRTGVEIGEYRDTIPSDVLAISSPEYKKYYDLLFNPDDPPANYRWFSGDTVRTAFGQGSNNYTAASMAKYIATLASRGARYQLHLEDKVQSQDGTLEQGFKPVLEAQVEAADSTWQAIYNGMLQVTEADHGTGTNVFRGFPIRVAGKTGTAQEKTGHNDHTSFGGFAPYDDPQIAVYVDIPFGNSNAAPAAASQVGKEIISDYMGFDTQPEGPKAVNVLVQ